MIMLDILVSCGSDRRPSGQRPAPSGQAGLGRAANARRAIERGPRPFGEEPPRERIKSKHTLSMARDVLASLGRPIDFQSRVVLDAVKATPCGWACGPALTAPAASARAMRQGRDGGTVLGSN